MVADEVLIEQAGDHILIVKLNRPEARNAVNAAVAQQLEAAIDRLEQTGALRAAILTSSVPSGVFCAGADLKAVAAGEGSKLSTERGGFGGFVKAKRSKPWIAAVGGKALGGGLEFSLACDMIVAGEEAAFGLPEVKRGIYAGAGGVFRLPRAVPRHIALEMITTGEPIGARRAYEIGLVNRVVPTDEVLASAIKLAEAIAVNAPLSVQESLAIARAASGAVEEQFWDMSREASGRIMTSEDAREGPRAFVEKRAPRWTGR